MTKTVPADFIGKADLGYALLALLSDDSKSQITKLIDVLNTELPGVLWPMPPEQLHITLCEIIQPKAYSQDKEALFNLHKDQYENVPVQILSNVPRFAISLDVIEVTPQAIIVRASDSSQFNNIRARLVAHMQLPSETRMPPDITHSSVARYLQEVDLETVRAVVSSQRISIKEVITEFLLIKNLVSPLQEFEILKTIPLATS